MAVNWNIPDRVFKEPEDRIKVHYGKAVKEAYIIEQTRPIAIFVQFGAIGAGASSGWKFDRDVENFFRPDKDVMYHWIPMLDAYLSVEYRYKGAPQLGSYRQPTGFGFDYTMGTQMAQYSIGGSSTSLFCMHKNFQMFSMYERMPEVNFTNMSGGVLTLRMLMFGKAYKLVPTDYDNLEKPYSIFEFGMPVQ